MIGCLDHHCTAGAVDSETRSDNARGVAIANGLRDTAPRMGVTASIRAGRRMNGGNTSGWNLVN